MHKFSPKIRLGMLINKKHVCSLSSVFPLGMFGYHQPTKISTSLRSHLEVRKETSRTQPVYMSKIEVAFRKAGFYPANFGSVAEWV